MRGRSVWLEHAPPLAGLMPTSEVPAMPTPGGKGRLAAEGTEEELGPEVQGCRRQGKRGATSSGFLSCRGESRPGEEQMCQSRVLLSVFMTC